MAYSHYARYEDAWLRQQFEPERERFTVETPPDPAHGDVTSEPPNAVVMQDAPVLQGGGEIITDVMIDGDPVSTLIDKTPLEGGGTRFTTGSQKGRGIGNVTRPLSADEDYGRRQMGAVRGRDEGAPKDQSSSPAPYRFYNENFFGTRTEGLSAPPITTGAGDKVLRRGLNAYPENDGDGGRHRAVGPGSWRVNIPSWKKGDYWGSNVNRDFNPPNRTHTNMRMVKPDVVTIIGDAPPPLKSDKYASPFSALQKFMPKRRRIRGPRRQPSPWDEDVVAAAPESYTSPPSADGMIVP